MKKIAFLGSKELGYNSLNYLILNSNSLQIELVAVLSNDRKLNCEDQSILELAKAHQIPVLTDPDELTSINPFDFLISVQYHKILTQEHIDCANELAINLHMAPLPEYRGCNQFSFAIIDGATQFGTTLHVMNTGIDTGDILFEQRFLIAKDETAKSLHKKTTEQSELLFRSSISKIITGNYTRTLQANFYNTRKQNFHLRNEVSEIKQIDCSWPDEKIDRYVRATYFPPFPPSFTIVNGKKIELSLNWRNEIPR